MSRKLKITALLMVTSMILMTMIFRLPDGKMHVWFLNVGQGDAALIKGPLGEIILIDGGPDNKVMEALNIGLMPYEREIDLVILSHPHADHLNGLIDVFKSYRVKNLLITGVKYDYAGYRELLRIAGNGGAKIWHVDGSFDLKLGRIGLDLIYPEKNLQNKSMENVNNSSIVLRVIYGSKKIMFSGDLEEEKEREIAQQNLHLGTDVFKAGHHGSKTSNTSEFLKKIKPDIAVISCGIDNKFRHPFPGTLERMSRLGITVYRTDLDGTVEMSTDGKNINWKTGL
jgi:beta-lactamase superfamily II metal-dependent hydrolase